MHRANRYLTIRGENRIFSRDQPMRLQRTVITLIFFLFFAVSTSAQLDSLSVIGPKGELITQYKKKPSRLFQEISAQCKDKGYWFKRMYGKKTYGVFTVRLRCNQEGEVGEVTRLSSTISDSSIEKSMIYSLRQWKIEDVDFPGSGVWMTCTFVFDPASLDVPPWQYIGKFTCDKSGWKPDRHEAGIWDPKEKTCVYIEVPSMPSASSRYSTFGNTEWILYEDFISQYQCSNHAQWQVPDSQNYIALDLLLSSDTSFAPLPLADLPQPVAQKLSQQGYSKLVAFYRQRNKFEYHSGTSVGLGGSSHYNPSTGSFYGGGPSVSIAIPTKDVELSVIASVYDLKTGKGLFHKSQDQTDYSLEQAVRSVICDLFSKLKKVN